MKKSQFLMLCLLASATRSFAQYEGSNAFTYKENNNHILELQSKSANPEKAGNVKIEFYGHMAFKITSPNGLTMLFDPWRNDPTGTFGIWFTNKFPEIPVDIVLSSHAHFDHDAVYRPHATMVLERMAGQFQLSDVRITGLADKHQSHAPGEVKWDQILKEKFNINNLTPPNNGMSWDNVIYIIETGGLKIGFWGDNRPDPGPEVAKQLIGLDVLFMNVDGSEHILSYDQIGKLLTRFKPKAVIPGHYLTKGAELEVSGLKSADQWVNMQPNKVKLTSAELILNKKRLEGSVAKVFYFGDNFIKN